MAALLGAAVVIGGCGGAGRDTRPLRAGFMICNSLEETRSRFAPLAAYLAEQLGRPVVPVYLDTVDFEEAVGRDEFDLIHTNSLLYVWFHEVHGYRILSGERRGRHGSFSGGAIVTEAESDVRTLDDLKGKRFVFGPQLAPTAFLSQYWVMLEGGIDPEKDLAYYAIPWGSYKHEKVIYSVLNDAYDAGAAPLLDLELMETANKIRPGSLRIVAEGPLVPYCVFSVPPSLPAGVEEKLRTVLFGLTAEATAAVEGEVLRVLKSAGVDGFEPLEEKDFDLVRRMAKRCNLPPYTEY